MASITKTAGQTLLAWANVANAAVSVGSALNVNTSLGVTVFVHLGRQTASAFTAGWPNIRIEASAKASGNDAWIPVAMFQPTVGASIANTTLNGACNAAATNCVVASASNIAAGDILLLGDTVANSNYELVRVKSVSGTTINFEEAVTNTHATGSQVTDQAEMYVAQLDLTGITRIRAVADNANSGQGIACEVLAVTGDSIG